MIRERTMAELAATLASPRAGSGQASHGSLADHIPLKLLQCGKNADHHPARWRRGVDLRALAGAQPQTDTALRQLLTRADQVGELSAALGRASCRARLCPDVSNPAGACYFKTKKQPLTITL